MRTELYSTLLRRTGAHQSGSSEPASTAGAISRWRDEAFLIGSAGDLLVGPSFGAGQS